MTDRPKPRKRKHPAAVALGRIGGSVASPAKSAAATRRNREYWADVRAGRRVRGSAAGYVDKAGARKARNAHALAEERSDDSQQRVVGGLNHEERP